MLCRTCCRLGSGGTVAQASKGIRFCVQKIVRAIVSGFSIGLLPEVFALVC